MLVAVVETIKAKQESFNIGGKPNETASNTVPILADDKGISAFLLSKVSPKFPTVPVVAESVTDCIDFTPSSPDASENGNICPTAGDATIEAVPVLPDTPSEFV